MRLTTGVVANGCRISLVRAGIPERVAMIITGQKRRSIFERNNVTSEGDLTDAARKLDIFAGAMAQR